MRTGTRVHVLTSLLLALVAAGAIVPAATAQAPATRGIRDIPELDGLAERWEGAMQTLGVPGFTVAVIKDGHLLALDAFGERDVEGRPADPDTMYYIASCTKTYVGMAIVKLAEQGRLDLDAPVRTYLPRFELSDPELTSTITLRDLLCHRYGINSSPIVIRDAYTGQITDETYFRLLRDAHIAGTIDYSNVHFTILGRVIEAVTGEKWQDYLHDEIFAPIGMSRTTAYASVMYGDDDSAEPMIQLDGEWQRCPLVKTDRTMHAAGGMGTTARDAATWLGLHLNAGEVNGTRLVSRDSMHEVLTMQAKFDATKGRIRAIDGFAIAWQAGTYRGLTPYYQHGGGYLGAVAFLSFMPEKGIGVAVLANCSGSGNGLCAIVSIDIYDRFLGVEDAEDLLPAYNQRARKMIAQQHGFDADAKNPAADGGLSLGAGRYTGEYANDSYGTIRFALEDGRLAANFGDLNIRLAAGETPDAFLGWIAPDMQYQGAFEIDVPTRKVIGVTLTGDDGETIDFRKAPPGSEPRK